MRSAASEVIERRAGIAVLFSFAFLAICFTGQFPPFANPNELSRIQSIYAFVEQGTFRIDGVLALYGDHEDKAMSGGHFYSNKAPGLSFAAIPVYRTLRFVFPRPATPFDAIWVLVRLIVVTPICVLALVRLLARLRRRVSPASTLVVAALAFGTPYLFYARSFFSHAWTAALLFLALDAIGTAEEAGSRRRVGLLLWGGGVLAGWAAISEYPLALLAGLLFLRCLSRPEPGAASTRIGHAVLFGLGLVVPLALLLGYDAACFGSPFVLSSAREALPKYAQLAHHGLFGFGPPRPMVALAYLIHPARGLLLFSPFWLWTAAGFVKWRRTREDRADWAFCLAATVVFFVAMTAYPNWHGGWSLGNRYLVPLIFPAGLALGHALASPVSRWGFAAATVFACAVHLLLASAWVHFPADMPWPVATGALWFVAHGWAAPGIFGSPPAWAPAAVVIHALAGIVALVPALASAGLPRGRGGLAAAAGLALFGASIAFPPRLGFASRLWRAEIFGIDSGRDPEFRELRALRDAAPTPEERSRVEEMLRGYGLAP
jgi:hypothetical protein